MDGGQVSGVEPAPVQQERACPGCGRMNANQYRFCLGCGGAMDAARAHPEPPPQEPSTGAPELRKIRSRMLWIALASVALSAVSIALTVWMVWSKVSNAIGRPTVGAAPPTSTEDAGPRDHMHLETDGVTKDVWISGWASYPHASHREYAFAGQLGCAGQRFTTNLTRHVRLDIGYTAHKAFVIVGEDPYVLAKPPVVEGKTLVWAGSFKNDDGHTRWFRLRIDCPLPAK
jgi:hypothetical protein